MKRRTVHYSDPSWPKPHAYCLLTRSPHASLSEIAEEVTCRSCVRSMSAKGWDDTGSRRWLARYQALAAQSGEVPEGWSPGREEWVAQLGGKVNHLVAAPLGSGVVLTWCGERIASRPSPRWHGRCAQCETHEQVAAEVRKIMEAE